MENIVHTQSRPYNHNSNPGPELPPSYEASVAQPPLLPPSDNFTTLAMNKKGNIFRPSLSLFYLFWFLLTFSALHSYHQWTETSKLCCIRRGLSISLLTSEQKISVQIVADQWEKEKRRQPTNEKRAESAVCCRHLLPTLELLPALFLM